MAKIKADDLVKGLKYVESQRRTFYSNQFPYNCGYIHPDGQQSWDCIGLVKCPINEPDIFYRTSPVGYYVKPGQVIPDTTEFGILKLCTDVSYSFSKIEKAEYMYMPGHGAWFVSEYRDPSGIVNTIEATAAMGGGVLSSYCDQYGNRYDHKGGTFLGRWEAHGKLSDYIEYEHEGGWVKYINGDWYYVENGSIVFNYNGLAQNENGWWMIQNGKVDFAYNGLATNKNGTWVLKNGKVDFGYNGDYAYSGSTWKIRSGKLQAS